MDERINDPKWLAEAVQSKTQTQIAAELGCGKSVVGNRIRDFGIKAPTKGDRIRGCKRSKATRKKMAAARRAYWERHPDREEFKLKISKTKTKTGMRNGYRYLYVPGRGYVAEHRHVVEQLIGRRLESHELVHHRDGNKTNNVAHNLEIVDGSQHALAHHARGDLSAPTTFRSATHKQCVKCFQTKPRAEFSPCKIRGRDPHMTRCKACCAADARERRQRRQAGT